MRPVWDAFWSLHARGEILPPLSTGEIRDYLDLACEEDPVYRLEFFALVRAMDSAWMKYRRENKRTAKAHSGDDLHRS